MGTNYYFELNKSFDSKSEAYSEMIKNGETDILEEYIQFGFHIGKSSVGWQFIFAKNSHYQNIEELKEFYHKYSDVFELCNEYDEVVDFDKFLKLVESKRDLQIDSYCEIHEDGTAWLDSDFS